MGKKKAFHDILPYLRRQWCPRAFALRPDYAAAPKWVEIHDDTGRWYRMPNKLMTGDELYSAWKRVITKTLGLAEGSIKKLVLICDDQDRVPNRKRKEREKRKQARVKSMKNAAAKAGKDGKLPSDKMAPPVRSFYNPSECMFTNEGVQFHGPDKHVELIDVRTLRASAEMRKDVYKYFMWKIQMDSSLQQTMDADASLVLDFHGSGPCIFRRDHGWMKLPHLKHTHGEADKAIVFWVIVYREFACSIVTNDRDMIAILFHYVLTEGYYRGHDHPLWWVYEVRADQIKAGLAGCLDVIAMTIKVAERWDSQLWLLACCMCGTDYVEKEECTPNAGQDVIFAAVQRNKDVARGIRLMVSAKTLEELKKRGDFEAFDKCTRHNRLAVDCWTMILKLIHDCSRAPNSKPVSLAAKMQSLDDIQFNMSYWAEKWSQYRGVSEFPVPQYEQQG